MNTIEGTRITVSAIRQYPAGPGVTDGAYYWTVTGPDPLGGAEGVTVAYRTDRRGDGLWLDDGKCTLDRQVLGHAQWTLAGVSASTRRRRVEALFVVRDGEGFVVEESVSLVGRATS